MRNLIPILILFFSSSCATKKNYLTDLEKIGLLGNVKYLKFIHQSNQENEFDDSDEEVAIIDNEYFFNKSGMIAEQREYSSNELSQTILFSYDKNNLLISKGYYDGEKKLTMRSIFENKLNNERKLYRQTEYRAWEKSLSDTTNVRYNIFPYEIIEYLYEGNGKLSKQNYYQSNTSFKIALEYQEKRIFKETIISLSDESIWGSTQYNCLKFDQNQNCIEYKDTKVKIEYYK
ncbi:MULTISPECIES: hypothetical protein [Maribacter]|uniref:Uncharacterized protein n=1 Tax=Maribacter flavus TaxID=1658664 RepID=A0A5B2TVL5_9FLAO|nr:MULTISPECIES: hypothetical protein [Maribacter]KAA2218384.1 hypothetical protein F0361_01815 [Maribacter flavus]MDC6404918.1 hypothetical protein [Maribacter sp. PR66]MEE1972332.1 hypothetical protein [Maribacter flavus]